MEAFNPSKHLRWLSCQVTYLVPTWRLWGHALYLEITGNLINLKHSILVVARLQGSKNDTHPSGRVENWILEYTWGRHASVGAGGGYSFDFFWFFFWFACKLGMPSFAPIFLGNWGLPVGCLKWGYTWINSSLVVLSWWSLSRCLKFWRSFPVNKNHLVFYNNTQPTRELNLPNPPKTSISTSIDKWQQ